MFGACQDADMPKIALSTGSLYTYGIARVFEMAAEAGFDGVEVLIDGRWDSRHPAYLQRLVRETGLPVVAVHNPFVPHVPGWSHDPIDRLRRSAGLARELDASVVVTHLPLRIRGAKVEFFGFPSRGLLLPIPFPNDKGYRRFLQEELPSFEAAEGVLVAVENMPAKRFLGCRVDIHALNWPQMPASIPHLTLDTTHLGTWGADVLAVYEELKGRIVHVHLSNYNGAEHRLPADGHLPLAGLLRQLDRDGYRGAVSLELGPEVLHAEQEIDVRRHLRQALTFCREHLN
jgi:sugar phosphate isomerase/epimerase